MSKVICAGPRDYYDYDMVVKAIEESKFAITELVSGTAQGVDSLGERWAREHLVPIKQYVPNWNKHGKAAGPIRNKEMAEYADALIAVVPYFSKGTANMIKQANELGLKIFIWPNQ